MRERRASADNKRLMHEVNGMAALGDMVNNTEGLHLGATRVGVWGVVMARSRLPADLG